MEITDTGPEIFETSDVESIESIPVLEETNSEVERSGLDTQLAKSKFENSVIEDTLDPADFLGNITRNGLYESGYMVRRAFETRSQKLTRIREELAELESEGKDDANVTDLQGKLGSLMEGTKSEHEYHEEKLKVILDLLNDRISDVPSVDSSNITFDTTKAAILDLEKKIADLESTIGVSELQSTKKLQNHIDDLGRKVEVLYDPEYDFAHIRNEIKKLLKEMEDFTTKKRMAKLTNGDVPYVPPTAFDVKVDTVYGIIPDLEKSIGIVPHMVERLRTLNMVHSDLAHSVTAVSELDKTMESMKMEMKSWIENLDRVSSAIDENSKGFEKVKEEVERRVKELEDRLGNVAK